MCLSPHDAFGTEVSALRGASPWGVPSSATPSRDDRRAWVLVPSQTSPSGRSRSAIKAPKSSRDENQCHWSQHGPCPCGGGLGACAASQTLSFLVKCPCDACHAGIGKVKKRTFWNSCMPAFPSGSCLWSCPAEGAMGHCHLLPTRKQNKGWQDQGLMENKDERGRGASGRSC